MIKGMISNLNINLQYFSIENNGIKNYYYLPARLFSVFGHSLLDGQIVALTITENTKIINHIRMYQIGSFLTISYPNSSKILYNAQALQRKVYEVLKNNSYYLIIDFEVSMARFREKNFQGQILQAGYLLVKLGQGEQNVLSGAQYTKEIRRDNLFLKPTNMDIHNPKIFNLIRASKEEYFRLCVDYMVFYEQLKTIMKEYNPKIVIWGANDIQTLNNSYLFNQVEPLTTKDNFINLLKLHRDFYNLTDDLGLYSAYNLYYDSSHVQDHDALNDALKTAFVLDAFYGVLRNIFEDE
ncbi:MAG: hypothetical protein LBV55_01640 [Acholeplasmatales bacterium]|jgi:sporulation inhibitor KapD|nr:hypothetical protein [Acholeplasmatales bacterium]